MKTRQTKSSRCLHPICSVLLACPFCGGKAKRGRKAIGFDTIADIVRCGAVRCPVHPETTPCDHRGILRGKRGAAEVWNHRPNVGGEATASEAHR